ncbi:L,D-transpeptidase family protein [Spirochaetota bacterium]
MQKILATIIFLIISLSCSEYRKKTEIRKAFKKFKGKYVLYVSKKYFFLEVYNRKIMPVNRYKIGYGRNPDKKHKLHEGDNRTPRGNYKINEILSMDAHRDSPSYKTLRALNRIYFKAKKGYHKQGRKNVDLGDNVYGPRYFGIDYPNELDKKQYKENIKKGIIKPVKGKIPGIGFGIAIHGNSDEKSIGHLCSSGCIRMFNNDIVELEKYVRINTPVIISSH